MAVEIKDGKKILVTPVSAEDLKDIHIGDIVYLTGQIRDGIRRAYYIYENGKV